jgi:hypothetical protein
MKTIPVDASRLTALVGAAVEPATTPSGQQRTDRTGKPLFNVPIVVVVEGAAPDTLTVRVPGPIGQMAPLTQVRLVGLIARPWQMDGRAGVSFSAQAVQPVQSPAQAQRS